MKLDLKPAAVEAALVAVVEAALAVAVVVEAMAAVVVAEEEAATVVAVEAAVANTKDIANLKKDAGFQPAS